MLVLKVASKEELNKKVVQNVYGDFIALEDVDVIVSSHGHETEILKGSFAKEK